MTAGLDTSVIVRLLVHEPAEQAHVARELVTAATADDPLRVSELAIVESYHALKHHYGVSEPDARAALLQLLADPRIHASDDATQALAHPDREPGLVDRLLHAQYHRDNTQLVTFDRRMARLPNARLLRS